MQANDVSCSSLWLHAKDTVIGSAWTVLLLLLTIGPAVAASDDIVGEWRSPSGVHMQVMNCGESICGRIVRLPDQSLPDIQNPEPRLRTRPVLGIQVFTGIRPAGTHGWKGHMYLPESGRTFVSRLISLDKGQLQVSMCGPMGLLCSREVWTRTR